MLGKEKEEKPPGINCQHNGSWHGQAGEQGGTVGDFPQIAVGTSTASRDLVPNRMNRGAGKKIKGKKIPGKVKTFRHSIFCSEFVFVLKGH